MFPKRILLAAVLILIGAGRSQAQVEITPDVVYGHKLGLAMTFDVFTPKENAHDTGVLFMVSGGWYSRWTDPQQAQRFFRPLTDKGFTVFRCPSRQQPEVFNSRSRLRRAAGRAVYPAERGRV